MINATDIPVFTTDLQPIYVSAETGSLFDRSNQYCNVRYIKTKNTWVFSKQIPAKLTFDLNELSDEEIETLQEIFEKSDISK